MKTLNFPGVKQRHQAEALERKAVSDAMTPQQRLDYLNDRGFTAKRERERLQRKIDNAKKKTAKPEEKPE